VLLRIAELLRQVKFVPTGLTALPSGIILMLRMPANHLDTNMSVFQAVVEVPRLLSAACVNQRDASQSQPVICSLGHAQFRRACPRTHAHRTAACHTDPRLVIETPSMEHPLQVLFPSPNHICGHHSLWCHLRWTFTTALQLSGMPAPPPVAAQTALLVAASDSVPQLVTANVTGISVAADGAASHATLLLSTGHAAGNLTSQARHCRSRGGPKYTRSPQPDMHTMALCTASVIHCDLSLAVTKCSHILF